MAGQTALFHALLRPVVLQILRATGYHATRPGVLDWLTDMAARYLGKLCQQTALHAHTSHGSVHVGVSDVGAALDDLGALLPRRYPRDTAWHYDADADDDDAEAMALRGVEEFVQWFASPRNRDLMEMGRGDGEMEATDYLMALKKKHDKSAEEKGYHGTMIGRPLDSPCDMPIQGGAGPDMSITDWIQHHSQAAAARPSCASNQAAGGAPNGHPSPSASSSGLSSVGRDLDASPGDAPADMDTS